MRKILSKPRVFCLIFLLGLLAACSGAPKADLENRQAGLKPHSLKVQAAQIDDLTTSSASQLAASLIGSGVVVSNVSYQGDPIAAGRFAFTGADDVFGFDKGIILSSGRVADVVGPNELPSTSTGTTGESDADLEGLVGASVFDTSALTIEFTPTSNKVFFEYVFASEEYNEYVNAGVNDVFGFFVNGVNYATVNGDPVSIDNINNGKNADFYRDNEGGEIFTEFDGLTTVLTFEAPVNAGKVNTLKLAIGDVGDSIYDSAVFIKASSLTTEDPGNITLDPPTSTNPVGTSHTVVATVRNDNNAPIVGTKVTFLVTAGPNQGKSGDGTTDALGQASFSYKGDGGPGTDTIEASFSSSTGQTEKATASKTWQGSSANLYTIDFSSLKVGQVVWKVEKGKGLQGAQGSERVIVYAKRFDSRRKLQNGNRAMIFDAECKGSAKKCSGGDDDLFNPGQGNIMIISQDGKSSNPNDNHWGGQMDFKFGTSFPKGVTLKSIRVMDVDHGAALFLYNGSKFLKRINVPRVTVGGASTIPVNVSGITFMRVGTYNSIAVDDIVFEASN